MYNELIKRNGLYNDDQVSMNFFSKENIDQVQNMIQASVYRQTNHKIGRQSDTELFIIMQSIHKQNSRNIQAYVQDQINELNDIVVKEATRLIIPKLLQHISYLENIDKGLQIMDYGSNTSSVGTKY